MALALIAALIGFGSWQLGDRAEHPVAATPAASVDPVLYVDASGVGGRCSDTRTVEEAASEETPWCTLPRAVAAAPAAATVRVRAGSYPHLDIMGAAGRQDYLTIEAAHGEDVLIDGLMIRSSNYLRFRGVRFGTKGPEIASGSEHIQLLGITTPRGVLIRTDTRHIVLAGSDISASCGNGVTLSADADTMTEIADVRILYNHFHDVGRDGIQAKKFRDLLIEGNEFERIDRCNPTGHSDVVQTVFGGDGLTFRDNYLHDNAAGILLNDGEVRRAVFENNVIVQQSDQYAMQLGQAPGLRLAHNTIWNTRYGVALHKDVSDAVVVNNIIGSLSIAGPGVVKVEDHNLLGRGRPMGANTRLTATPGFVAADRLDYRLGLRSPAVDFAARGHDAPTTDITGRPRGARPDAGAIERRPGDAASAVLLRTLAVSIAAGAEATNALRVPLDLGAAGESAREILVSDVPDWSRGRRLSPGRTVTWRFPSTSARVKRRRVFVRLLPSNKTGVGTILLDRARPKVRRARLAGRSLRVAVADRGSGVRAIQVSPRRNASAAIRRYRRRVRLRQAPRDGVYVRVRDGAGNWSSWVASG